MEAKPFLGNADDGKDWFFKDGKFERAVPLVNSETDFDAAVAAAGYRQICKFGMEYGFGLQISQQGDNYMVSLEYGDSFQIIWIESFCDYMEVSVRESPWA